MMNSQARANAWIGALQEAPDLLADLGAWREAARLADGRRYLAWSEFRRRPMPPGRTAEQLWALVRLQRMGSAVVLPLETLRGSPTRVTVTDPLRAALHRIACHQKLQDAGMRKADTDAETYAHRACIEEAMSSARIEGADTVRVVGRELLRTGREPRDRSERMILNNFLALRRLDDWTDQPLTPALLCQIQEVLTRDTLDDPEDSGRLRRDDEVRVRDRMTAEVVHVPPPASELEQRVRKLCEFANEPPGEAPFLDPVVRASVLHYQLAYDHPFGDGNGRTARWLFLWSLVRRPEYWWCRYLPVSRMIERAREAYYRAFVHAAEDGGDSTYLVRQQVGCMEIEMERLAMLLQRRRELYERARRKLRIEDEFNVRQIALFDHAVRHADAEFTQLGHAQYHDVTQVTAGRDLNQLEKLGFLSHKRRGRTIVYRPTARLLRLAER
jgi:Fic family protein